MAHHCCRALLVTALVGASAVAPVGPLRQQKRVTPQRFTIDLGSLLVTLCGDMRSKGGR